MKLLYIYLEEDYKNIPKGGYYFDKEFIVEELKPRELIKLKNNPDYYNPYNDSIANMTCIVGKNGIGKTTFFELLIAPLLWRLDGEMLVSKLHLLFYDKRNDDFLIESYINDAKNWKLHINGLSKTLYKHQIYQNVDEKDKSENYPLSKYGYSVMPFQMNIIFHSLSPFDRIYTLLRSKLSNANSQKEKHYDKRFRYIGIKQIENVDISYEYMTIINVINLFLKYDSKQMMKNMGYIFKGLEINFIIDSDFTIEIPDFEKLEMDSIDSQLYTKISKKLYIYTSLECFDDSFFNLLLYKNLKIDTVSRFNFFINQVEELYPTKGIDEAVDDFLTNIQLHIKISRLFDTT